MQRKINIFGQEMYAYVYVDQNNALKHFSEYLIENEEEYESMKTKDKDWATVRYGFFILLSNIDTTPKELLTEYFGNRLFRDRDLREDPVSDVLPRKERQCNS